jgi:hypothetical protein
MRHPIKTNFLDKFRYLHLSRLAAMRSQETIHTNAFNWVNEKQDIRFIYQRSGYV